MSFPGHPLSPATMTIFGAGGDLTKRLIVPALYNLVRAGKLPDDLVIIGVDHNDLTTEEWCGNLAEMMQAFTRAAGGERHGDAIDQRAWSWLIHRMHYMRGDFMQPETFSQLKKLLIDQRGRQNDAGNVLFYLAVGHLLFATSSDHLRPSGLPR